LTRYNLGIVTFIKWILDFDYSRDHEHLKQAQKDTEVDAKNIHEFLEENFNSHTWAFSDPILDRFKLTWGEKEVTYKLEKNLITTSYNKKDVRFYNRDNNKQYKRMLKDIVKYLDRV